MLLAGGICALGYAPLNLWPLPFLGLTLLIDRVMRVARVREVFLAGWCFALAHFLIALNWIPTAFTHQANMPAWLGWLGLTLLSMYLGLFPALAAALAWLLARQQRLAFVLLFAAVWMLCEWLRGWLLGGFPWNPIGIIWLPLPWVSQGAKWIGTYGLSGLLVLAAGLLWLGLQSRWRAAAACALTLIMAGILLGRLPGATQADSSAGIPVRIVQPNISEDEKNDPDQAESNMQRYAVLSGAPTSQARVLLWPEGATPDILEFEPAYVAPASVRRVRAQLAALLGPHDILLAGGASAIIDLHGDQDVYHNSVFALDSSGKTRWRYDKAHLVPFGEFLPARPILERIGLSRLVEAEGDFSPGPGPRTFVVPGFLADGKPLTVAVQICYEIIFSGRVIDEAHRPSFLFNPSNDGWFGAWGPPQHLAQARLRAIEEGIPIIRATPNGISAVIGPTGQLLATIPWHTAAVVDAQIPAALPPTIFSRFGLWSSALFGLSLGTAGILTNRSRIRPERAAAPRSPGAPGPDVAAANRLMRDVKG